MGEKGEAEEGETGNNDDDSDDGRVEARALLLKSLIRDDSLKLLRDSSRKFS